MRASLRFLDQNIFPKKAAARVAIISRGTTRAAGNSGITVTTPSSASCSMGVPRLSKSWVRVKSKMQLLSAVAVKLIVTKVPSPVNGDAGDKNVQMTRT